jgi:hypothetical protein
MNKLLKHIFALVFILCVGHIADAQVYVAPPRFERRHAYQERVVVVQQRNQPNPERRIENIKVRFLKQQLNLTPEQSQKFFPLYHEYQMELFNMIKLKRLNNTNAQANGTDQINKDMYYDSQIISIKMRFKDAFLKILPPEKVSELYKSEREFNDELVRSLSERNGNPAN